MIRKKSNFFKVSKKKCGILENKTKENFFVTKNLHYSTNNNKRWLLKIDCKMMIIKNNKNKTLSLKYLSRILLNYSNNKEEEEK